MVTFANLRAGRSAKYGVRLVAVGELKVRPGYGIWRVAAGRDMGRGTWDMGYEIWDIGCGTLDMGSERIWDIGYGIWDMGYEMISMLAGIRTRDLLFRSPAP